MTELETKQAARIADLETALRSMAQIAHDAIGEQSRFLADSLDYGMRVILETAGLEPLSGVRALCLGHPCDGTQCPSCAVVRSQNAGTVDAVLHPNGKCGCAGEGTCAWCVRTQANIDRGESAGAEEEAGIPCDGGGLCNRTDCAMRGCIAGVSRRATAAPPPIGDCTKPPLPGGWSCSLHANHSGPCSELPF